MQLGQRFLKREPAVCLVLRAKQDRARVDGLSRKDGIVDQKVIGQIDWSSPKTVAYFKSLAKG